MAGLLDSILDGMSNGAAVVSENHNLGSINWVNGMSDPGEMISCGYLPEARRQSRESDSDYAKRIQVIIDALPADQRAKIIGRGTQSAIRRASLDMSNGRVNAMFAGKAPWHGLGTVIDKAATSAEAIRFAGLDWTVEKVQLQYHWQDGMHKHATDAFGIIRKDTGDFLGAVGSRYKPVQNSEGFDFLDGVLEQFGAKYESAGSIYGGKSVWMLAHMPAQRFGVNGDEIEPYVIFANCHDGTGAAWAYPTTVRVECANTFRTSSREKNKGLSIRHTGSVKGKIATAQAALGFAVKTFDQFRESAEALVSKPCEIKAYASDVLDACLDVTAAQVKLGSSALAAALDVTEANRELAIKSFDQKIKRRGEVLEDILSRYDSGRCHPQGTAWGAFNAITEHADHNTLGRKASDTVTRLSRRFESTLAGDRDEMKQVAFTHALAL